MASLFKLPTTYAEFLEELHPKHMVVSFMDIRTIEDSISKKRTTLQDLEETYGSEATVNYIDHWLKVLNESLNIARKLDDTRRIAIMIYDRFDYLNITDLKLVYDKIMYGDGVRFYGSVDAQAILGAFTDFSSQRLIIMNKAYSEIGSKYEQQYRKFIDNEKQKLWAQTSDLSQEERFPAFERLCKAEIPKLETKFYEKLFQKKLHDNKEK